MKFDLIVFSVLVVLITMFTAIVRSEEGEITIEPCVEVSWDMTTNHVYTLWIADEVGGAYYKHPAYTEYTPTTNRKGHVHSNVVSPSRFFKIEVDGVMYASYPDTNAVAYVVVISTNNLPPMP